MTAMPQMVALFNGVGGGAVALIACVEFRECSGGDNSALEALIPILFAAIIGSISFWGSNIAFGKLQEILPGRPIQLPGQQFINVGLLADRGRAARSRSPPAPSREGLFSLILVAAALLGNMLVLPIGGADMPVVISLLNAFTGLSAAAAGIALDNIALIVAGMLVGASGSILTKLMAEAMNRSIANIFAGGFGGVDRDRRATATASRGRCAPPTPPTWRSSSPTRAWSSSCPATAWRSRRRSTRSRELADELEKRGVEVNYAIHPVAGPHARPHERAAGRGRRALRPAQGDGRDQPRVPADRRRARDRRQRRDQPGRARRRRTRRSTACRSSTSTRPAR